MAEWLMKKAVLENKLDWIKVYSCGTHALPSFRMPPIVNTVLSKEGIDARGHRPTQITKQIADASDLIIVMTGDHKNYVNTCYPEAKEKTFVFKEYVGLDGEIADPIGLDNSIYENMAEEIKICVEKLVGKINKTTTDNRP